METVKSPLDTLEEILIVPYSHTDYAWTNTRDWHICRYIEGMNEALDELKAHGDFTWLIDNVTHFLLPYLENCPERAEELKEYVREGRIAVAAGGYSLARPSYVGDETYLRNLVEGERELRRLLDYDGKMDFFFNADTGCGHSQLPQILQLGGYAYYRFFRSEQALDFKQIPKQFLWTGLDGSTVLVSRGNYGGFLFASYLEKDFDADWPAVREAFYREELEERLRLLPTGTVLLNHGCDDFLPLHNLLDRPIRLREFMEEWNKREKSVMRFATPYDYFHSLEKKELPVVHDVLDPCEISYNAPFKGGASLWRMREELNTLLVRLETLCAMLYARGQSYPAEEIQGLWRMLFELTGHAMEFILAQDAERIRWIGEEARYRALNLIARKEKELASLSGSGTNEEFVLLNTMGYERDEVVKLHITSASGVREFRLLDEEGGEIPCQIAEVYTGDKNYESYFYNAADVYARVRVPALSATVIRVENGPQPLGELPSRRTLCTSPVKERITRRCLTLDNGLVSVSFEEGLPAAVTTSAGKLIRPAGEEGLFRLRFTETEPARDWLSNWTPLHETSFTVEEAHLRHNGPIRWEYVTTGKLDGSSAAVTFILNAGDPSLYMELCIDGSGREGFYTAEFACDPDTPLYADIPFGVEKRELEGECVNSGAEAVDLAGCVELNLPGQFYGRSWAAFECAGVPMALMVQDWSIYYCHDRRRNTVAAILNRNIDLSKPIIWR